MAIRDAINGALSNKEERLTNLVQTLMRRGDASASGRRRRASAAFAPRRKREPDQGSLEVSGSVRLLAIIALLSGSVATRPSQHETNLPQLPPVLRAQSLYVDHRNSSPTAAAISSQNP